MQLYTDALGTHGWGAYWSGRWLQRSWSPAQCFMNIAWKELFAICVVHIPGADNNIADVLCRSQMAKVYQLTPLARQAPDPIPVWPSQSFTNASCNAVIMELPPLLPLRRILLPAILHLACLFIIASIITNPTIFLCLQITACVPQNLESAFVWYPCVAHRRGFQWPNIWSTVATSL